MLSRPCPLLVLLSVFSLSCGQVKQPPAPKVVRRAVIAQRRVDPPPRQPPAHPNILLITLDTLRYDATGLAPQSSNRTPFLRQLAANGIEFTRSYSTFDSTPE